MIHTLMALDKVKSLVFAKNNCLPFFFRQYSVRIIGRRGVSPPPTHMFPDMAALWAMLQSCPC